MSDSIFVRSASNTHDRQGTIGTLWHTGLRRCRGQALTYASGTRPLCRACESFAPARARLNQKCPRPLRDSLTVGGTKFATDRPRATQSAVQAVEQHAGLLSHTNRTTSSEFPGPASSHPLATAIPGRLDTCHQCDDACIVWHTVARKNDTDPNLSKPRIAPAPDEFTPQIRPWPSLSPTTTRP